MPNQKGAKRGLESSKYRLTSETANEANATTGNVLFDNCHNYAANPLTLALNGEEIDHFSTLPVTPLKLPAPKKLIRSDNPEIMVKENMLKIEGLKKTIDFICAEMKDVKGEVSDLEKKVTREEGRVDNCQQRLAELERYLRRWNLRLQGAEETEKEDIRRKEIEICQSVLAEHKHKLPDAIDVVHRLGAKRPGGTKPRGIIIQFTSRILRDATWKAAKTSSYLRNKRLKFTVQGGQRTMQ
ncbi:hypothetical protein CRENBAI_019132 [Crenichthys baileyi]|uniref:Uncharacterized protein n=1 Tax=Crenichthys baileyi TaxID=28760 RepID=A0AAV9SPC2_9TELE